MLTRKLHPCQLVPFATSLQKPVDDVNLLPIVPPNAKLSIGLSTKPSARTLPQLLLVQVLPTSLVFCFLPTARPQN